VSRLQTALKGFGGNNCTGVTPGQNGCLYYNPFASAIPGDVKQGIVNPNFVPTSANSPELARYLFGKDDLDRRATEIVVDAVFSGETGLELPGGKLAWAAGAQFREEDFLAQYNDLSNYAINPCRDPGDRSCLQVAGAAPGVTDNALATGVFDFLGGGFNAKVSQNVSAVFTELSLPILDSLSAQVAVRYEDYGGAVGNTTDPKLSVRYQATDWLAFRGSIGTSFRGPPATQLVPNSATAQQFIQQAGGFRAIRVFGNPDLQPESATTFNLGLLFNAGGLRGSIDYFHYHFEDQITAEGFQGIITNAFTGANNTAGTPTINCNSGVANRIVFSGNVPCTTLVPTTVNGVTTLQPMTATNLAAVKTNIINGNGLKTDGVDIDLEYAFNNVFDGALTVGLNATYVLDFDVNAETINGIVTTPAFDGAGFNNVNTGYTPLPDWKGSLFLNYNRGIHNVRLVTRFTDQFRDTRSTLDQQRNIFTARPSTGNVANRRGEIIDSYITNDLTYLLSLPGEVTVSAAVTNVFDKDPPFSRLELGYDPTTASPIGRAIEVGVRKKF
jgi:iron complex outermembrane receptor protein